MGLKGINIRTQLDVRDCVSLFKTIAPKSAGGLAALSGKLGASQGYDATGFYDPENHGFPSHGSGAPVAQLGYKVPRVRGGMRGNTTDVEIFVWEHGDFRQVVLASPHAIGGGMHASQVLNRLIQAMQQRDGTLTSAPL